MVNMPSRLLAIGSWSQIHKITSAGHFFRPNTRAKTARDVFSGATIIHGEKMGETTGTVFGFRIPGQQDLEDVTDKILDFGRFVSFDC